MSDEEKCTCLTCQNYRLRAEVEKLRAENNEAYVFGLHKGKEAAFIDYGIERLRAENEKLREESRSAGERITGYIHMIEQREAEIEKLRAALKPFADIGNNYGNWEAVRVPTDVLRTAAAALKETGDE